MLSIKKVKQIKPFVFILLLLPGLFWFYQFSTGSLGINPIEKLMDKLGETALRLIILTLFISSYIADSDFMLTYSEVISTLFKKVTFLESFKNSIDSDLILISLLKLDVA